MAMTETEAGTTAELAGMAPLFEETAATEVAGASEETVATEVAGTSEDAATTEVAGASEDTAATEVAGASEDAGAMEEEAGIAAPVLDGIDDAMTEVVAGIADAAALVLTTG